MTHLVLSWGYLALFFVTVLAAMGIPTGSELVIAFAGALASGTVNDGSQHLNLAAVIVVASAGELLGSSFGYGIGRVGGRALVDRLGRFVLVTSDDVDRAEHLFERRGQSVVFFGRFVPLLRSFVGLAAGIAEMTVVRFLAFTGVAAAIWCSLFAVLGFELGSQWSRDLRGVSDLGYGVAVFVVAIVGIAFGKRYKAAKRSQATTDAEHEKLQHRRVGLRPLQERFRSCPAKPSGTRQDNGARVDVTGEAVTPDN